MTPDVLERKSAKLARLVVDGVCSPNRADDVATTINNAVKQVIQEAIAQARAEAIEECARVAEQYRSDEPELVACMGYKNRIAAAIRGMK